VREEKSDLLEIIGGFSQIKVAVWGDFILDEYIYGTTRRISREAPVLILSYKAKELTLGGGGNALLNLKALGSDPIPVGVVGKDEAGKRILQTLRQKKIETAYLLQEKSYVTPLKTRILAGEHSTRKQQILRIDREARVSDAKDLKRNLLAALQKALRQSDALLISDYDYYTVKEDIWTTISRTLHKSSKPITLDSRFRLLKFKGVTVLTPNEPEVEHALQIELDDNEEMVRKAGSQLLHRSEAKAVLITRGARGMMLFQRGKQPHEIPIHGSTDIVDVTGAGDTVISVLTLALAGGATFRQAARLANYAGGIAVMKKGTATVSPQELKEAIGSEN
jgi:rfaE bifunctional protein kinase chain/domain